MTRNAIMANVTGQNVTNCHAARILLLNLTDNYNQKKG